MLYIMPNDKWETYRNEGQSQLLTDTKNAILCRYPKTDIKVDRLVVSVSFSDFYIEVQPVFEQDDGSFKYPDTYNGCMWKTTKPRKEIAAMKSFVDNKSNNLRLLCKMLRSWKNKQGIPIGGLLIDTLAYNFLGSTSKYDNIGFSDYHEMSKAFFEFLMNEPEQEYYLALGSQQRVAVKKSFKKSAKEAYGFCAEAVTAGESGKAFSKWRELYGRSFPSQPKLTIEAYDHSLTQWKNTEQFIEDTYNIDIKYDFELDCIVERNGFRPISLRHLLATKNTRLPCNRNLHFVVSNISVPKPYIMKWKVLNRGKEAEKRNCIRGEIMTDKGRNDLNEKTDFFGDHFVECYIIKNNIVVARNKISVPISSDTN